MQSATIVNPTINGEIFNPQRDFRRAPNERFAPRDQRGAPKNDGEARKPRIL